MQPDLQVVAKLQEGEQKIADNNNSRQKHSQQATVSVLNLAG